MWPRQRILCFGFQRADVALRAFGMLDGSGQAGLVQVAGDLASLRGDFHNYFWARWEIVGLKHDLHGACADG